MTLPCSMTTLPGDGTLLQVKIGTTFTTVAAVVEVEGPSLVIEAVEATHLASTVHTFRPSRIPNLEKMNFKIFYDPSDTTHQLLIADASTPGGCEDWQLLFVDEFTTHASVTWTGFVSSFKVTGVKIDENVGADVEIQPTTIPIFVPGTGP